MKGGEYHMATGATPLSQDQIDALLGSVRERGAYKRVFNEFLASEDLGINVTELFNGKKSSTVYQGFNNVKKEQENDSIRVINHEDTVYLIKQG
jgi:hypothetical protein